MNRDEVIGFRINAEERNMLNTIVAELDRDQSEALRYLIRRTAREIKRLKEHTPHVLYADISSETSEIRHAA